MSNNDSEFKNLLDDSNTEEVKSGCASIILIIRIR